MNPIYVDLHGPLESYSVTESGEPDELAGVVIRDILDKLFVQEVLHPDGELDVDVSLSRGVEDALVVPEAFSISSYSITQEAQQYRIELAAEHAEYDYTYAFEGIVRRVQVPNVRVTRAAIETNESAPSQRHA